MCVKKHPSKTIIGIGNKRFQRVALALRDTCPDYTHPERRAAWFNLVCLVAEALKPGIYNRAVVEREQFKLIATGKLVL